MMFLVKEVPPANGLIGAAKRRINVMRENLKWRRCGFTEFGWQFSWCIGLVTALAGFG
jgi:hypothetical protein